jgi:polynucleotide 5'-kinase involved in rRNA processing
MTPIESIYEIQSAVKDLQRYLNHKDVSVSYRAQERYEKWVDRFFRENVNVVEPEKRRNLRFLCLQNFDYFLNLLEATVEYYDFNVELGY